jgi:predicted small secreted protein
MLFSGQLRLYKEYMYMPKIKIFFLIIALIGLSAVSACNTINGIGRDLKSGGQAIEDISK